MLKRWCRKSSRYFFVNSTATYIRPRFPQPLSSSSPSLLLKRVRTDRFHGYSVLRDLARPPSSSLMFSCYTRTHMIHAHFRERVTRRRAFFRPRVGKGGGGGGDASWFSRFPSRRFHAYARRGTRLEKSYDEIHPREWTKRSPTSLVKPSLSRSFLRFDRNG